jgi:hypothetical protein
VRSAGMAHYRFANLLGAPYRGGNLCMVGNNLLTSIGNRVSEVDLQLAASTTLPCENLTEIECTAVSPSGLHMISFDTDGRAILVNLRCATVHQLTQPSNILRDCNTAAATASACKAHRVRWRRPVDSSCTPSFAPPQQTCPTRR